MFLDLLGSVWFLRGFRVLSFWGFLGFYGFSGFMSVFRISGVFEVLNLGVLAFFRF